MGRKPGAYVNFYIVYRKKDDMIVATGTSAECAKQLNSKNFRSLVHKARHGKPCKYEIEVMSLNEGEDK